MKNESYVTVYRSISGWKAVLVWWNDSEPELGGFWEPYQTGLDAYETEEEAVNEGRHWALSERIEFKEKDGTL